MLATIGYERAELGDFIATLQASNVEMLVDIRDRAQSRRPGFSKVTLSKALAEAGIDYLHLKELGDPPEGREAARRGDIARFHAVFRKVLESDQAKDALSRLEDLALTRRICLMCFERSQLLCHRKIVAEHLEDALSTKARHLGVAKNAGHESSSRRVRYPNQSAASPI